VLDYDIDPVLRRSTDCWINTPTGRSPTFSTHAVIGQEKANSSAHTSRCGFRTDMA
jgi:hypothetical protein